jgi:hypothetical protein
MFPMFPVVPQKEHRAFTARTQAFNHSAPARLQNPMPCLPKLQHQVVFKWLNLGSSSPRILNHVIRRGVAIHPEHGYCRSPGTLPQNFSAANGPARKRHLPPMEDHALTRTPWHTALLRSLCGAQLVFTGLMKSRTCRHHDLVLGLGMRS